MKIPLRHYSKNKGFTVVELLTTMAIIGILIGLLIPALGLIRKTAYKVKQKSQFSAIAFGLEGFQLDFGYYPSSENVGSGDLRGYGGAQKLAEAIIGWDSFGVHPDTEFRPDGEADIDRDGELELIYDVTNGITGSGGVFTQTPEENRVVRKGPYIELESANGVKLSDIYANAATDLNLGNLSNHDPAENYVLTDMFGKVKNRTTGRKTGMPILYYKADTNGIEHQPPTANPTANNIYNIKDNSHIYEAPVPFTGSDVHPLTDDANESIFYDITTQPNYPAVGNTPRRPFNEESYILHSAGPDGLYGTADDIFNFDSDQSGF